jgi:hypothetical protein
MFTVTSSDTGLTFTFASEEAHAAAREWVEGIDKQLVIDFCKREGVEIVEQTDDPYFRDGTKLIEDWDNVAAELYARVKGL